MVISISMNNKENLTSSSAFPHAPIQFIGVDAKSGDLFVTTEARAALSSLGPGKLCVIGVTGMYRTGKSSLINFMRQGHGQTGRVVNSSTDSSNHKKAGFAVLHTVERGTRGIWMWIEPEKAILETGEECWVLHLDSEGVGGIDSNEHHDCRIFALTTLLCSTLIYNSLGTIDATAISSLSFVTQLAKHIHINPPIDDRGESNNNYDAGDGSLEFRRYFPSFLWVVRDFQLELEDGSGSPITEDDYLEKALRPQSGFDASTVQQNRIRAAISSYFSSRSCVTLVRPLMNEARLQNMNDIDFHELRQEFRDGLERLKNRVYVHNLRPKIVNNIAISGRSLGALCDQYVAAISNGAVPEINSAWQNVMRNECQDAIKVALNHYDASSAKKISTTVVDTSTLVDLHITLVRESIELFLSRSGGPETRAYQDTLEGQLRVRYAKLVDQNYEKSVVMCRESLDSLYSKLIKPKLGEGKADNMPKGYLEKQQPFQLFREDLRYLVTCYNSKPTNETGPAKDAELLAFYMDKVLGAISGLADSLNESHEAAVAQIQKVVDEYRLNEAFNKSVREVVTKSADAANADMIKGRAEKLHLESRLNFVTKQVKIHESALKNAKEQIKTLEVQIEMQKNKAATDSVFFASRLKEKDQFAESILEACLRVSILIEMILWAAFIIYSHIFDSDVPAGPENEIGLLGPSWLRKIFLRFSLSVHDSSFNDRTVQHWSLPWIPSLPWSDIASGLSLGFIPSTAQSSVSPSDLNVLNPTFEYNVARRVCFCTALSFVTYVSVQGVMELSQLNLSITIFMNLVFYYGVMDPRLRFNIFVLCASPSIPYLLNVFLCGVKKVIRRCFQYDYTIAVGNELRSLSSAVGSGWENISPQKWRRVWKERAREALKEKGMSELANKNIPLSPDNPNNQSTTDVPDSAVKATE